jgi:carboxyl-terminal processing protease
MKKIILYTLSGLLFLTLINGCKKDVSGTEEEISEETIAVNKWIYDNMSLYYLWNNEMPVDLDYTKESDSEEYFYKLLYDDKDKYSYITDDYTSLKAEFNGTPITMGYNPAFYLVGTNTVIIVVSYVYPGSSADDAGLERGDIILSIDNTLLDTTNYYTKYSGTSYSVQLGAVSNNTLNYTGESLSMTARVTQTDPSIYHTVLDIDGHKIGYLVYVEFISGDNDAFLTELDNIFNEFKAAGISDLVVDLRYNPGGEIDAAVHLASEIAPNAVTVANEVLVDLRYNTDFQEYLELNNYDDYLYYKFKTSAANINMGKVYFLTTSGSASASELLITGLQPYMDVVQIGESTYGKYVGSWLLPDDNEEWAMMPVVMKYSNADGYTDFADGLTPDYEIDDDLISALPFGDVSDPMLAKAIELATGKSARSDKSVSVSPVIFKQIIPEEMKIRRNLIIHNNSPKISSFQR